jgi:AbrB family looped-hinge helix DNA binding protein
VEGSAGGEAAGPRRAVPGDGGNEVIPASLTGVRVTRKGQVTIPLPIRRALGIEAGSEVSFELEGDGARLVAANGQAAAEEVAAMRGAGDVALSTEEILAFTRR